jgi:hypothetical protein
LVTNERYSTLVVLFNRNISYAIYITLKVLFTVFYLIIVVPKCQYTTISKYFIDKQEMKKMSMTVYICLFCALKLLYQ